MFVLESWSILERLSGHPGFVLSAKNHQLILTLEGGKATLEYRGELAGKALRLREIKSKPEKERVLKKIQNYLPPEIAMTPKFVGRLEDGRLFVVTSPQEVSDQLWRVYIGLKGSLKEYKATEISVFRDGGTTIVKFAEGGVLFSVTSQGTGNPIFAFKKRRENWNS